MSTIIDIPRTLIDRCPTQPRVDLGDIEQLAAELRAAGRNDTAIQVRRKAERYEIVDGERRWTAAELAELPTLRCEVIEATDLEVHLRQLRAGNGKPLTPIEEARGYKRLEDEHGLTRAEIADHVGRSISHVRSRLLLAEMVPAAQALLEAKRIGYASAARLAHLPAELQEAAVDALTRMHPVGMISTLDVVQALEHHTHRLAMAPFETAAEALVEEPCHGPCTTCEHNSATQRDLFDADQDEHAVCLYPPGWDAKVAANEALVRADAEKAGHRILDATEMRLVLDAGRVRPQAPWVAIDTLIDDTSADALTWRDFEKQLGEADPDGLGYAIDKVVLAVDDGRPVWLLDRNYAAGFITKLYPRRAAELRGEPDPDVLAAKEEKKALKEKEAAEAEIDAAVIAALISGATKSVHAKAPHHFALMVADVVGAAVLKAVATRRELELEEEATGKQLSHRDAIERAMVDMDAPDLWVVALEMIATRVIGDDAASQRALTSMCDLYGVDRKTIAKELKNAKRNVKSRGRKKGASAAAEAPAE